MQQQLYYLNESFVADNEGENGMQWHDRNAKKFSKAKKRDRNRKYSRTSNDDIDMTTARIYWWLQAKSVFQWYSLPDHLLVSFVYISKYVGIGTGTYYVDSFF